MRTQLSATLITIILGWPSLLHAIMLDCEKVVIDGATFNVKTLGGPRSVFMLQREETSFIKNTTFTVDICAKLGRSADKQQEEECTNGSQICALERFYKKDRKEGESEPIPNEVWPIAGEFHLENRPATLTRLKGSESHADADKEGFRVEMTGGEHDGVKQKALIEFLCDHDKTGLEGLSDEAETKPSEKSRREDGDNTGEGEEDPEEPLPDPNKGKALRLVSYKPETSGKNDEVMGVLRLEWSTKYACETQDVNDPPSPGTPSKQGWGFFTWFIIILFLAVAAYLIFGSWLNYSRYGARGWDLLPHGDTIRDIPYLLREWARKVLNTVQGHGGSRGYSAI